MKLAVNELAYLKIKRELETPAKLSCKRVNIALLDTLSTNNPREDFNARLRLKIAAFIILNRRKFITNHYGST